MKLENIIAFRNWLYDYTSKASYDDHTFSEREIMNFVKDKFSSLGLNDNKIE